jgi:hypothetical protein
MIRPCADVQSTPSLTSIESEPATAITANDRSWHRPDVAGGAELDTSNNLAFLVGS